MSLYPKPRRSHMKRWRKLRALGIPFPRPARNLDGTARIRCTKQMSKQCLMLVGEVKL